MEKNGDHFGSESFQGRLGIISVLGIISGAVHRTRVRGVPKIFTLSERALLESPRGHESFRLKTYRNFFGLLMLLGGQLLLVIISELLKAEERFRSDYQN